MRGDQYRTSETLACCCYYTVSTYCLTEDHISPLLEEETLGYAAGGLLQKHKCHGFLSPLHHLHHTLLQPGHQRTQLLPPVACEERWDGDRRGEKGQTEMEWQPWCGCGRINTPEAINVSLTVGITRSQEVKHRSQSVTGSTVQLLPEHEIKLYYTVWSVNSISPQYFLC